MDTQPPWRLPLLSWLVVICLLKLSFAATTTDWKSRSIYQVFTDRFARTDGSTTAQCDTAAGLYCGGTWKGIINHLDYIQGMGFDAIMISPVTENLPGRVTYGEAYHGYWPQNIYELNDNFGSRQDLLELADALHSRKMYFMVDIVINNMAYITNGSDPATSVDYSVFVPFNDKKYFHPYCKITNYEDYDNAQRCWTGDDIVPLPDLFTEHDDVTSTMSSWTKELVANYSIDGLRIDAAKHVSTGYLAKVVDAAGVFATGEVYESDVNIACTYQDYIPSIPNYPLYFAMIKTFSDGNVTALPSELSKDKQVCKDVTTLATFSENHDLPRFASKTKDLSLAKNVLTYTILSDGIPMFYQGQEQHFSGGDTPSNREAVWTSGYDSNSELYKFTTSLNKIRAQTIRKDPQYLDKQSYPIFTNSNSSTFAVMKGTTGKHMITVYSTNGENGGQFTEAFHLTYEPGRVITEVLNCKNYTVDEYGTLEIVMERGLPRVLYPADLMDGSDLCGAGNTTKPDDLKKGSAGFRSSMIPSSLALGGLISALVTMFVMSI